MPKPYPSEFRERALELVRSGRSVVDVAAALGVAQSCLYRWKQQDLVDRGLAPSSGRVASAELIAARRRIRELEEENKILRKAAAAVEQVCPQKPGSVSWTSSTLTESGCVALAWPWACRRRATTTGDPVLPRPDRSAMPG